MEEETLASSEVQVVKVVDEKDSNVDPIKVTYCFTAFVFCTMVKLE